MRASLVIPLLGFACGVEPSWPEAPDSEWAQLIFGADDRAEFYELTDPVARGVARSVVGLLPTADLVPRAGGGWRVPAVRDLSYWYDVCPSEPFADQPVPLSCSGFLVGPDLVATAGHCISQADCADTSFVFDYRYDAPGQLHQWLEADDVYTCAAVLGRSNTWTVDWAIVQLDRPVVGHPPAPVRRAGQPRLGDPLVVSGHPLGLPLKTAGDAVVGDTSPVAWFGANLDTFGGNSGSIVADAVTGEAQGIFVRGYDDFVRNGRCFVYDTCPQAGCPELQEVTRASVYDHLVPPLAFQVVVPADAGVGEVFDVAVRGAAPRARLHLVTGAPGGATDVPGCPGLVSELGGVQLLATARANAAGSVDLAFTVPRAASGRTVPFQVVDLDACAITALALTTVP